MLVLIFSLSFKRIRKDEICDSSVCKGLLVSDIRELVREVSDEGDEEVSLKSTLEPANTRVCLWSMLTFQTQISGSGPQTSV